MNRRLVCKRTIYVESLANQARGDQSGKTCFAVVPPAKVIVTLLADGKCPGMPGKPTGFSGGLARFGGTGSVAVTQHMKG